MEPKVNYTVVGLFVVGLGVVLVGVVLWLGKGNYRATYDRYYAFMKESVAGLSVNAQVEYHGVEVGRVTEIVLNPDNSEEVRLTLEIARGTPIKQDTVAVLHVQGLTGFAIVDLNGGTREAPLLTAKPGEQYPVIRTAPSLLTRLDQEGSRLLANLNRVTEGVGQATSEENRAALQRILQNLTSVTEALAARSQELDRGVASGAQAMANLAASTQALRAALPPVMERIGRSATSLERLTKDMGQVSLAINTLVKETRPDIERFTRQTLAEAGFLVADLRELTASAKRVARQLEREPNALIFGRRNASPGPGE